MGLLIGFFSNVLALYVANWLVSGFSVSGGWKGFLIAGLVLGLLNGLVRPLLKLISLPILLLTLGLFSIVINALIIWLVSQITPFITIASISALIWATIIIGLINAFAGKLKNRES